MSKRFSSEFLYQIRNDIPLTYLLPNVLKHPCKFSEGFVRFLCPECSEFNTAINNSTNLGRCFACQKNYNTIDFVMRLKQFPFPKAVYFLRSHLSVLAEIYQQM